MVVPVSMMARHHGAGLISFERPEATLTPERVRTKMLPNNFTVLKFLMFSIKIKCEQKSSGAIHSVHGSTECGGGDKVWGARCPSPSSLRGGMRVEHKFACGLTRIIADGRG